MKTFELLVLIFAFLVGYMLYKRCGCTEGMVTDTCSDTLESLCGTEQKFPSLDCAKCTGSKQSDLKVARCTAENMDDFCHNNNNNNMIPLEGGDRDNEIIIPINDKCVIDKSISNFLDLNKIANHNNGQQIVTTEQCGDLQKQLNVPPIKICTNFGGNGGINSFDRSDITNYNSCASICDMYYNGEWRVDELQGKAECVINPP